MFYFGNVKNISNFFLNGVRRQGVEQRLKIEWSPGMSQPYGNVIS